jgi:hypothetical protein
MMVRILATLFLLTLASPAFAQEYSWYAQAISDGSNGISATHFWAKGRSLRALTIVRGRPILTMVHRDWYYVVDELGGKGIAIQRGTQALREDAKGLRPFAMESMLIVEQGAEKVRTEMLHDQIVDVWRLTDQKASREVWTAEDRPDIPLMVQVFDRATNDKRTVRYIDWSWEMKIPERFFRPDARFVLERMSYDEYLLRTADSNLYLPVFYSSLLHGRERVGK